MALVKIEDIDAEAVQNSRGDLGDLDDLVRSFKEIGQLQPLLVRSNEKRGDSRFELIGGFRRLAAAQKLGWDEVEVIEVDAAGGEPIRAAEVVWHDNFGRLQLSPIEEARFFDRYQREFHVTRKHVSKNLSVPEARVRSRLKLLEHPLAVQELIGSGKLPQSRLGLFDQLIKFPHHATAYARLLFPEQKLAEALDEAGNERFGIEEIEDGYYVLTEVTRQLMFLWIDGETARAQLQAEGAEGGDVPPSQWPFLEIVNPNAYGHIDVSGELVMAGDLPRVRLVDLYEHFTDSEQVIFQRHVKEGLVDNAKAAGVLAQVVLEQDTGTRSQVSFVTDYDWYWAQVEASINFTLEEIRKADDARPATASDEDGSYTRPDSSAWQGEGTHAPPAEQKVSPNSVAARNARFLAFQQNQEFGQNLYAKVPDDELTVDDMKMVATILLELEYIGKKFGQGQSFNLEAIWPGMAKITEKGKGDKTWFLGEVEEHDNEIAWKLVDAAKTPAEVMRALKVIFASTQLRHDWEPFSKQLVRGLPEVYGAGSSVRGKLMVSAKQKIRGIAESCMSPAMLELYQAKNNDLFRSKITDYMVKPLATPDDVPLAESEPLEQDAAETDAEREARAAAEEREFIENESS